MRTWLRATLAGALAGVVLVAVTAVLVVAGWGPFAREPKGDPSGPVLVVLALRASSGGSVARTMDLVTAERGRTVVTSIDPETSVTVPGTTGRTLRDAYTYGGGSALASAYAKATGGRRPAWVIVGPSAWDALLDASSLTLQLPADMEVFDGKRLVSFTSGVQSVRASDAGMMMQGAEFLNGADARTIRQELGDRVIGALSTGGPQAAALVASDIPQAELPGWFKTLGNPFRAAGR